MSDEFNDQFYNETVAQTGSGWVKFKGKWKYMSASEYAKMKEEYGQMLNATTASIGSAYVGPMGKPEARKKPTRHKPDSDELPLPSERVSVFGQQYSTSDEKAWKYFAGAGWIVTAEEPAFVQEYGECCINKTWHKRSFLSRTHDSKFVNNRLLKEGDWLMCSMTSLAFPKDKGITVIDRHGKEMLVSPTAMKSHLFKDDFDGRVYPMSDRISISKPKKLKNVSRYNIDSQKVPVCVCTGCGRFFDDMEEVRVREASNHKLCFECWDTEVTKHIVKAYNHKEFPKPIHSERLVWRVDRATGEARKIPDPDERLYGIEIEAEVMGATSKQNVRNRMAFNVIKALGSEYCIAKHDGSLNNGGADGFEIVTCPADLEAHRKYIPKIETAEGFKSLRAWDTESCGLHIHVSKAPLTTLQIGRILTFVNAAQNKSFIEKVAGRSAMKYCRYMPKKPSDSLHPDTGGHDEARRVAVNVQNKATIEFRIFRGTVLAKHILRNLEFVDACCSFCYPGDRSLKELYDYKAFIIYCGKNRSRWPLLNGWLEFHDMTKKKKLGPGMTAPEVVESGAVEKPVGVKKKSILDSLGEVEF